MSYAHHLFRKPERIKGESQNKVGTYTVSSDVWSLGLSMIEMAIGQYPYPPETYANVFAQLTAIVHGDPPELPENFSDESRDFVARCLHKVPEQRATYAELLVSIVFQASISEHNCWVVDNFMYAEPPISASRP